MKSFSKMTYEEKLEMIFDFYMWAFLQNNNRKKIDILANECIFPKSDCLRVQQNTICSEFKFISSQSKEDCVLDQNLNIVVLQNIKRLLIHEGFISKGE
jgi:hypothetical protein